MTAAFEPVELLTAALTAVLLALPIAVVVAAGVLAAPRRRAGVPGLAIGIGLLLGVVLAVVITVAGPLDPLRTLTTLTWVLGLLSGMAAAVLIVLRRAPDGRSEEHTSELQSRGHLVCRLLLEKKKKTSLHTKLVRES